MFSQILAVYFTICINHFFILFYCVIYWVLGENNRLMVFQSIKNVINNMHTLNLKRIRPLFFIQCLSKKKWKKKLDLE